MRYDCRVRYRKFRILRHQKAGVGGGDSGVNPRVVWNKENHASQRPEWAEAGENVKNNKRL